MVRRDTYHDYVTYEDLANARGRIAAEFIVNGIRNRLIARSGAGM